MSIAAVFREIPLHARVYIGSVVAVGLAVAAYSLYVTLTGSSFQWLYLACVTVAGSFFAVMIPSRKRQVQSITVTVSDIFIFTSILLYGPEVAVVICLIDAILGSFRSRNRLYKALFNISQLSVVTFVVGKLFYTLQTGPVPLDPRQVDIPVFIIQVALSALFYFVLNSGAVALAISLVAGQPVTEVWRENFLWASLTNFAGASAAAVIFLYFSEIQLYGVAVALPSMIVIYYTFKVNLERARQAQSHVRELSELYHSTIAALAMAIDAKDQCTHGHVHRVQTLTLGLARACAIEDENELAGLTAASLLHDIGKLAIPEYILNKPGRLTESEMQKMKAHPVVGADILESVPFPYPVVPFVRHHHEKWDGTGYPDGLKEEEIPLGARILAIVDCYDALRSDRPYRKALSQEAALDYIQQEAGKSYDPQVVKTLVRNIHRLEAEVESAEKLVSRSVLHHIESSVQKPEQTVKDIHQTVFHQIASTQREIHAIYEISQSVGKSLNVAETLSLLSSKIRDLVPYDACAIYLSSSRSDRMVPYHVAGLYADLLETLDIRIGDGVTGWVAANNQPLINVAPMPDFEDVRVLRRGFRTCLSVPLGIDESVVGVITLYSGSPTGFRPDHHRVMEAISEHAATAIKNAIIYEETQEDAFTDLLTGLPNLRYFKIFVDQEMKRASRTNYSLTLLMMDLEHFKRVNDRFGHRVGDRVLIEMAHILRNQMRKSDTCIRYGGDEFVAVLPGVSKLMAGHTVARIQEAITSHRVIIDDRSQVQMGISVGSATYPDDGRELDELMALADRLMYRNKVKRTRHAPGDTAAAKGF